jgi:hypothetical protein
MPNLRPSTVYFNSVHRDKPAFFYIAFLDLVHLASHRSKTVVMPKKKGSFLV